MGKFPEPRRLPPGRAFKRLNRPRLVKVHHGVELIRQSSVEVVAQTLGLGTVDHADGPLQPLRAQGRGELPVLACHEQEARQMRLVKKQFVTLRQRRAHALALGQPAPIRRRCHRAGVGGEADERGLAPIPLAHKLPDIKPPIFAALGRARIAQVRVVLPDHDLGP